MGGIRTLSRAYLNLKEWHRWRGVTLFVVMNIAIVQYVLYPMFTVDKRCLHMYTNCISTVGTVNTDAGGDLCGTSGLSGCTSNLYADF